MHISWVVSQMLSWRRLLRVPWTARRSRQSILKEISPEYSLESWNPNTLATWCEELTAWKRPWCWEQLKAGGEGDDRGWEGWMATPTQWIWVWASFGSWWWKGKPGTLQSMGSQRVRHDWATELNWRTGLINNHALYRTLYIHLISSKSRGNLCAYLGKKVLSRETEKYKDLEARTCLICSRNNKISASIVS